MKKSTESITALNSLENENTGRFNSVEAVSALYKALAEQASDSFYVHDGNGRIMEVNQHACDQLGYTKEELLRMLVTDIEQDFNLESAQAEWAKISPGESFTLNGHQKRRDGTTFPVVVSFGCAVIGGEKIYLGHARDTTETEQTEQKYRAIVEGAPDPIFIQTDNKFAYLNPAACTFFGINSPEELIGTPILERVHPDNRDIVVERIRLLNVERKPVTALFEQMFVRKDGSAIWAETKGEPIVYNGTKGALVFVRDTSKRRAAEAALRKSEEKYSILFNDASLPAVLIKLSNRVIVDVNKAWSDLFGFDREEAIGKTTVELNLFRDTNLRDKVLGDIGQLNSLRDIEMTLYSKSGDKLTVLMNINLLDIDGERYALNSAQDITARKRAEEKLFEISERFQKSFEFSAIGMCLTGLDGKLFDVNEKMCEMFGCSKDELLGRHFSDITYADDISILNDAVRRMLSGECKSISSEKRYIRKNGDVFWAATNSTVLRESDGNPVHFISQIQDITERRQMVEELRAREQFNRAVMDNLPIGISVNSVYPAVEFDYMNDKFPLFYRTTKEALKDTDSFWNAVYENAEFRETIKKKVLDDIASGDVKKMRWENIPITRQGKETSYITAYNAYVPDKEMFISIVTDETERVRAVETIRSNAARLQAIHEFDRAILTGFDSFFSIGESVVKYIFEMLKPDMAGIGILGQDDTVIYLVKTLRGEQVVETYQKAVGERELLQLGEISKKLDFFRCDKQPPAVIAHLFGCQGTCSCYNIPIYSASRLVGILNLGVIAPGELLESDAVTIQEMVTQVALAIEQKRLLNITERYAAGLEQMIRNRTIQLEAAVKELEAFSYSISHDLKAPLRSISGFVRILLEDYGSALDDEGKRICDVVSSSVQQMGVLIDDLLSLSKIGRSSMTLTMVNMRVMVESVYTEMTTEDQRKRIDFSVGQLPEAFVDPALIRQVWINLLDNAIKFSSKKPRAEIFVNGKDTGDEIVFSVSDKGAGFDMKYHDKLFGVFQRLHNSNEFEGTGVGLAIVQRIVNRHGGSVWANGDENIGATFSFSIKKEADNDVAGNY